MLTDIKKSGEWAAGLLNCAPIMAESTLQNSLERYR